MTAGAWRTRFATRSGSIAPTQVRLGQWCGSSPIQMHQVRSKGALWLRSERQERGGKYSRFVAAELRQKDDRALRYIDGLLRSAGLRLIREGCSQWGASYAVPTFLLAAFPRSSSVPSACLDTRDLHGVRFLHTHCAGPAVSHDSRDALWDKFYTAAPQRLRLSVEQYKIVKRA